MEREEHSRRLLEYLQEQQPAMLDMLRRLVSAESPTSVPESQEAVLQQLSQALSALDFAGEIIPGQKMGGVLTAWPRQERRPAVEGNNSPYQLLVGHCDTVWPIGTLAEMPFAVKGNRIQGPGVYDMKGGLVQMIFAFQAIRAIGLPLEVTPLVFINSDEEMGSRESTPTIRRLAHGADRAFILEPSLGPAGKLKTRRKGVGRFQINIHGRAAHAGLDPEKGISAILEMAYIIQKLFAMNDPAAGVSVNVGMIAGGVRPNVIAAESSAQIDVRVPTRETAEKVEQAILKLSPEIEGISLEIEGSINRPPLEKTAANEQLWQTARELGELLNLKLEEGMAGGGSDGNTTSLYTATLDGLGAVGDGAHAQHEFVCLDKMAERSALLALLLLSPPLSLE
jgi:glutamate carboxypeptidase